jgi:Lrp/AsnC family leucine-responsive transcriptional regulator
MATKPERLLDDIGWNILTALQEDARISFSHLGRRVGLSAPAAAERVRRMEDAGIITGYRVALAVDKLGYPIMALLRISAPEENCLRLGTAAKALPQVLESHRVTGSDRLVVKVAASSVGHLDEIIGELSKYGTVTAAIVLKSRSGAVARPSPVSRNRGRKGLRVSS